MISAAGFRRLAVLTAVSAYLQITLGTTVRVSQSGLGCPDWPLCHGRLYPILDLHSIIEFSHRALGTITGLLVIATVFFAWRLYRRTRPVVVKLAGGVLIAIALEGVLGGLVVFHDLASWLVLGHLALALAIVGLLVATAVAASPVQKRATVSPGFRSLTVVGAVLTYVLTLTGGTVVASRADETCKSWPLCGGGLQPNFAGLDVFNMLHRLLAAVVVVVILAIAVEAVRRYRDAPGVAPAAVAAGVLVAFQGLVLGPGVAFTRDNPYWNGLHVAAATLVWIAVLLVALAAARLVPTAEPGRRLSLQEAPSA